MRNGILKDSDMGHGDFLNREGDLGIPKFRHEDLFFPSQYYCFHKLISTNFAVLYMQIKAKRPDAAYVMARHNAICQ